MRKDAIEALVARVLQACASKHESFGLHDSAGYNIGDDDNRQLTVGDIKQLADAVAALAADAGRLEAKPARDAVYGNTHPFVFRAVMDAIERTVMSCDIQRDYPREIQETDYAGILVAAVQKAQLMARIDAARDAEGG